MAAGAVAITGLGGAGQHLARPARPARPATVRTRDPQAAVTVLPGSPEVASANVASLLLADAPVVVIATATSPAELTAAAAMARRAHAPLLLSAPAVDTAGWTPGAAAVTAALRVPSADGIQTAAPPLLPTVRSLRASVVLAVGEPATLLARQLPGVRVVASIKALPRTRPAVMLSRVVVLTGSDGSAASTALALAVATTAQAAGAHVISLPGYDPRADPAAISTLAAIRPARVIGVGTGFGPASQLAARVAVAETGVQLPGGGQVLFPMREVVALYGSPAAPALGALGQQGLAASIARAKAVAAQYSSLVGVPVVPAFEIIATVATGGPGPAGTYSNAQSPAALQPWVEAAVQAGLYVILDLQPGRADLLAQAKLYQPLLELPDVGLALDPEWALQPGQLPLHQIGSVSIAEVNSVATWLAGLTAEYRLPQKLLELHEFRLSMIQDVGQLDTSNDDLAIVINMDGQGAPSSKQATWQAVVAGAPRGVFFGWKDFYVKDAPMPGPSATILRAPMPVLISYE